MISRQKISKYISELLFIHDCVIIPDFGGFIANSNRTIVTNGTVFFPPSKQLVFNKNLTRNDGLLINFIAEKENLSYPEAQFEVKKYVRELNFELKDLNKYLIEKVGEFRFGNELTLQFEQDLSNNFLVESFGLSKISFPELSELNNLENEPKIRRLDKESINISIKKSFIRKTLISIPVILALTIIPFKSNITNQNIVSKASILDLSLDSSSNIIAKQIDDKTNVKTAMFYEEPENILVEEKLVVENFKIDTVVEAENNKLEDSFNQFEKGKYYLIVGSFNNAESANVQKQIYDKQGLTTHVMDQGKNRFRVCVNVFENKIEANNQIIKLRKENQKLQVWLLEI